jgi:hypothetical protein
MFLTVLTPGRAWRSAASAPLTASPHRLKAVTVDGTVPIRASSPAAVGTTRASFTPTDSGSAARSIAFSTSTSRPPQQSVPNSSPTDTSNTTGVAARVEARSSSGTASLSQWRSAETPRCSTCTPFGVPVEPEV